MIGKQKALLLVEDDNVIRDLYKEVLEDAGFEVDVAADGEQGAVKAREGGYALILLDIMMPKVDGIEFLKDLKERPPAKKNGAIVMLTNLAHDPVIQEGLKLGAAGFLIKSDIKADQLVEKINPFIK